MIVLKFGGTSVANGQAIRRAVDIVTNRSVRGPIVVASAMAGVTDALVKVAALASRRDEKEALSLVHELEERHRGVLADVVSDSQIREATETRLGNLFTTLRAAVDELAVPGPELGRGTDAVLGHGELLSTTLLRAALEDSGASAEWVDAREVVVTDDRFGGATPDPVEIARRATERLEPLVGRQTIPVTQGFIGATLEGIPTTLGRGGSDFTAALLGAALEVEEVQIWTDVHGLMTADPRVVDDARPLYEASYDEAAELAYFGAKVLHPATMIPVIEAGIPIRIRNSMDPDAPGTTISTVSIGEPGEVKSIASKSRVTTLSLQAPRMLGTHGFLRRMFDIFDRYEVSLDVVSTSEVSISVSIEDGAVSDPLLDELKTLGEVEVRPERAIICVVGEGLRDTPGVAARIFRAVAPVNVEMISQGASGINVTLVVKGEDAAEAVRQLHAEFF
ncbi:MAG: lysine-sensitive aspartokinase 3 [Longimicrobiales bacterium]|nr:lysine-sensitive aspartokinase 3 [Longimicrobiales bacterium]